VAKFENPVIKELLERYRRIWSLGHAMGLMGWDEETYMPSQGVVERATAMAELRTLYQELITRSSLITGFSNLATEATCLEEGPVK